MEPSPLVRLLCASSPMGLPCRARQCHPQVQIWNRPSRMEVSCRKWLGLSGTWCCPPHAICLSFQSGGRGPGRDLSPAAESLLPQLQLHGVFQAFPASPPLWTVTEYTPGGGSLRRPWTGHGWTLLFCRCHQAVWSHLLGWPDMWLGLWAETNKHVRGITWCFDL